MKAASLVKKIEALGGTAAVVSEKHSWGAQQTVSGQLVGYDIRMVLQDGGASFFTSRAQSKRGQYDPGSDYNPGGYSYHRRLRDLEWLVERGR